MRNESNCMNALFKELNKQNVNYCVIEGNDAFQPLDLFVNIDDNERLKKILRMNFYEETEQKGQGYNFIYGLEPETYWSVGEEIKIHLACQMSCVSMSNLGKYKLPLDQKIQDSIWNNKVWDERKKYWKLCKEDLFIYILTDCVFNRRHFDEDAIFRIVNLNVDLTKKSIVEKLRSVFFMYTPELIKAIEEKRFKDIMVEYRCFKRY